MADNVKTSAIILAAGRGSRMKSNVPKQYMQINDKPVLYYSMSAFEGSDVDEIIVVTGAEEVEYCKNEIIEKYGFKKVSAVVCGGAERYNSVMNGLLAVSKDTDYVFIHDGARPCVTRKVIDNCYADVKKYGAAVAAVPVKDTIKIADEQGFAKLTPDRSSLWQIQTPQCFSYKLALSAYKTMISDDNKGNITDDAMVIEKYTDVKVKLTMGEYNNIKITTPEDIAVVQADLERMCMS